MCTVSWFDLQSIAPSINARPGKNTHTLIQVITRCVFRQEAKLLTGRHRYFLKFFVFFRCCLVQVGFFYRQYTCQSVSTVRLLIWDPGAWCSQVVTLGFLHSEGFFLFEDLFLFFKLIFPKLFLCLCLYDCIPWCLLRALAALNDGRTVFVGWAQMQHLRSISLLYKQYVSALKLRSSGFFLFIFVLLFRFPLVL